MDNLPEQPKIKPPTLKKGATIGVVAPAGCVEAEALGKGIKVLSGLGFRIELAAEAKSRKGYLAGDQEKRAEAVANFFTREDIDAIFCARGGFGSVQLLPFLRPEVIRAHPKIFVGYSDVSILLNWLNRSCRLVTFHGPMVAMDLAHGLSGRAEDFFWGTLSGRKLTWKFDRLETVRPGRGEGEMVGGCLSVVVTTLGTPYEIETAGKILFLEDIGEKPYRIERMLTHLKMAGKLDGVEGLALGSFTNCDGDGDRGIKEIVSEIFAQASYPVVAGFPAGHGEENLLIPIGAKMAVDGLEGSLSLLESPVTS